MKSTSTAIGILGGTFDPIHMGHLRMAIEAREQLDLKVVHLIPSYQPAHRQAPLASPLERLAMVTAAIANEPTLLADSREIDRGSISYTMDTLIDLRREMPETPLCLLLGVDAFLGLHTWHRFQEILDYAHLAILGRPTYILPDQGPLSELLQNHLKSEISYLHHHLAGGIFQIPMTAIDISASDIRKLIAMGSNPRYLLPDSVYHYIQQHGTYNK